MSDTRNRSRKTTRKAGPPEAPEFKAPGSGNGDGNNKAQSGNGRQGGKGGNGNGRGRSGNGRNRRGNNPYQDATGNNPAGGNTGGGQGAGDSDVANFGRSRRTVVKSMQGADLTERLPEPPKQPKNGMRIVALGGISEIGRNMTVFEYKGRMLLIDCGVLFPSSGEPGVDLILPDFSYIEDRLDKIDALVITHGHEDHIGAIPWLLKLRHDIPIVASKFTCALIAAKCKEHRQRPKLIEVDNTSDVTYGEFRVRFYTVNHSIPDCLGIVLSTEAGTILHTGDIKLDQTPTDGKPTDLPAISRYGDEGVDLFLCDSTNATVPGISGSESDIRPTLNRLVADAKQRVILASFASNVYRVQTAVDAAVAAGRKVAFSGRSMVRNMEIAQQLGYLTAPKDTFVSMDQAAKMDPRKVMLITTGTQGEPMAALSRMARREHRQITVRDGDLIILSSSLVPGNEEAVFGVINMLAQIGATVVTGKDAKVHTSGHGYAGELLFLYNAVRPVNAMPVHGEWRHLRANKELAVSTGVPRDNVVLAQNGVVVDLVDGRASVVGQIPVGHLYVDGVTMGDVDEEVLADRTSMGEGGLISITVVIDNRTGLPIEIPTVVTKGFSEDSAEMMPAVRDVVRDTLQMLASEGENDTYRMVQRLRRKVARFVENKWRRKPMVIPTLVAMSSKNVSADEDEVRRNRESL
ncbi:ribonuclease J [Corynebacterium mendelii]|uniref:Ribonuclease J n=1 Tax=Corynebacterium mendelii TaxID=2765362 RepID=A0A939E0M1_9CORY|nr:ribonuclease J [Corynebacterium mendelii]MBN9643292.1 ribonuclease J [Corynebacterium mendelii]